MLNRTIDGSFAGIGDEDFENVKNGFVDKGYVVNFSGICAWLIRYKYINTTVVINDFV